MKIDKITYKDRKKRLNGMTAENTGQPQKVLFFADTHFLFLRPRTQMAHCLLHETQVNASQKKSNLANTNFKIK